MSPLTTAVLFWSSVEIISSPSGPSSSNSWMETEKIRTGAQNGTLQSCERTRTPSDPPQRESWSALSPIHMKHANPGEKRLHSRPGGIQQSSEPPSEPPQSSGSFLSTLSQGCGGSLRAEDSVPLFLQEDLRCSSKSS